MTRSMKIRLVALAAALLTLGALLAPSAALAQSADPAQQLAGLTGHIDGAMADVKAGNVAGAMAEYEAFDQAWPGIESGVRQTDRTMYRDIEARMTDVQAAFSAQPPAVARISAALEALDGSVDGFTQRYGGANVPAAASQPAAEAAPSGGMAAELRSLVEAQQRIAAKDAPGAAAAVQAFIHGWPSVEGAVAAKDGATYTRT